MAITTGKQGTPGINVTPLIDVLLVLLIIFMVVAPLKPVGLAAQIPQPSENEAPPPQSVDSTVVLSIASDLTLTLNSEPVDHSGLAARLTEIFSRRADRTVFVRAAAEVEFQHVARAMDVAKHAGVDRIGLMGTVN